MSYAAVVPHEAVEFYGGDFTRHPVGTGPYRLSEWRRNYRLTYAASDTWYGGRPHIPLISQRIIADPTTRWMCFLRAELDICPDIPRDSWDAVMRPDGALQPFLEVRGIRAASIPTLTTSYIGINMDDPLLGSNLKLRRALNAMVDNTAWVKFYNGRIVPATGPIPPGIAGSRATTRKPAYDPDAARRLLAEAGFTNGMDARTGRRLQLQLELGRTDTETRESTELLVRFAERIGIVIQPNYNTQSASFRKIERRQAQMFRVGWVADYPDAENFLQLFYSANASPGPNRANYQNSTFDRLYEKVRTMPDSLERTTIYEEMSAIVEEDCPWIFLHHPLDLTLQHPWVTNYRPHAFPYGMEKYYQIDTARTTCERKQR
jgi:ABC-type transport system substrate-binding protein